MSDSLAFPVTFFKDKRAVAKHQELWTCAALAGRIRAITAATKERLPWLKLAVFGEATTDANCLRHDGNVVAATGVEGDYDGNTVSIEDAVEVAKRAGLICIRPVAAAG